MSDEPPADTLMGCCSMSVCSFVLSRPDRNIKSIVAFRLVHGKWYATCNVRVRQFTVRTNWLWETTLSSNRSYTVAVAAEAQIQTSVRRVFPGDAEGLQIQMFAVPPDTQTMLPQVQAGRWLRPEDEHTLVISTGMQEEKPDLQIGSMLTLKIDDRETTWQVVGIMPTFAELRWVYASYDVSSQ